MNLLHDIKATLKFITQMRKARKAGAAGIETRPVRTFHKARPTRWAFTMEGCLLASYVSIVSSETRQAVISAFYTLPEKTQRALTFTPEAPGEWIQRAALWRELLRPVLPPKEFHHVMGIFARHYVRCIKQRNAASPQASRV